MNDTTEFDQTKRQVSQLMDGELDRDAARFLLRRLTADKPLQGIWSRYHLLGECLRHPGSRLLGSNFAEGVRRRIDHHDDADAPISPAPASSARKDVPVWLKPIAGLAMAAAVAGIAVFAIGDRINTLPEAETLADTEAPVPFVSPNIPIAGPAQGNTVPASLAIGSPDPARLNQYLQQQGQPSAVTVERNYVPVLIISERRGGVAGVQAPLRAISEGDSGSGSDKSPQ